MYGSLINVKLAADAAAQCVDLMVMYHICVLFHQHIHRLHCIESMTA